MPRRSSRVDSSLRYLQFRGVSRGVLGGSRGWFWVAVASFGLRMVRRALTSDYELVYRGELKPGEGIHVEHLTETREGGRVRSRRRRIRA